MRTVDRITIAAPPARVFALAADVERWPDLLSHYRWVRIHERGPEQCIVEMAAWRPFGPLRWPTWWMSEMVVDHSRWEVRYRHIRGVTRGMDVVWHLDPTDGGTRVSLVHEWDGPAWPLIRRPAAEWVIGPVFVHGIASRTLAGIGRAAEEREEHGG
jgi:ribosome-associated toxin RatA of RatAB toxin-antitoxin module